MRLLISLALVAAGVWSYAATVDFAIGNDVKKTLELTDLIRQLGGKTSLTAQDPPRKSPVTYDGIPLNAALDAVYGEEWHRFDTIGFSSRDGYTPTVPVAVIERTPGLIAIAESGMNGFTDIKLPNDEAINPGPAYLVWDNAKAVANKDQDWLAWPWQLTRVALLKFSALFPHSAPPGDASAEVTAGFKVFQQHCVKCHRLNGEGGTVGPELNLPESVVEKYSREKLAQLVRDPQSLMPKTKMPGLPVKNDQDRQNVNDLIEYLHYTARHKFSAGK